jgi:hypothetical protein
MGFTAMSLGFRRLHCFRRHFKEVVSPRRAAYNSDGQITPPNILGSGGFGGNGSGGGFGAGVGRGPGGAGGGTGLGFGGRLIGIGE